MNIQQRDIKKSYSLSSQDGQKYKILHQDIMEYCSDILKIVHVKEINCIISDN